MKKYGRQKKTELKPDLKKCHQDYKWVKCGQGKRRQAWGYKISSKNGKIFQRCQNFHYLEIRPLQGNIPDIPKLIKYPDICIQVVCFIWHQHDFPGGNELLTFHELYRVCLTPHLTVKQRNLSWVPHDSCHVTMTNPSHFYLQCSEWISMIIPCHSHVPFWKNNYRTNHLFLCTI